jgi:hypothetical protein
MTTASETIARPAAAPAAAVRSRVSVPLRFPDGFTADAEVMTFSGFADGKSTSCWVLASGSRQRGTGRGAVRDLWCACTASA